MIRIRDLDFTYRGGEFRLAIDALDVEGGTAAAVVGPSGSGKTTWLHLLAGILMPDAGNTCCPTCGRRVIERTGYRIQSNTLKNGRCPECQTEIYGLWS